MGARPVTSSVGSVTLYNHHHTSTVDSIGSLKAQYAQLPPTRHMPSVTGKSIAHELRLVSKSSSRVKPESIAIWSLDSGFERLFSGRIECYGLAVLQLKFMGYIYPPKIPDAFFQKVFRR